MTKIKSLIPLIVIIIAGFLFLSYGWKGDRNDLANKSLKGPVKVLRRHDYQAVKKFGRVVIDEEDDEFNMIVETRYDINGNMTEKIGYWKGSLFSKSIYEYSDEGDLIEVSFYDSNSRLERKIIYEYDSQGESKKKIYNPDGSLKSLVIYKYDENNNYLGLDKFSGGEMVRQVNIKYGENGNRIETESFNFKTNSYDVNQYVYSKNNFKSNSYYTIQYLRNGKNETIETIDHDPFNDNYGKVITKFKYDKDGKRKLMKSYSPSGKLIDGTKTIYEDYDNYGNWLKKIHIELPSGTPSSIIKREIEYYDSFWTVNFF